MNRRRLRFPRGFLWGAITSSYQIEGAWDEDGKAPSVWDTFCHQPGTVERGENGDVACDHYHRWSDDVRLMAELGLQAYCFSISWPRIMPEGIGRVNPAGLDFYDRLVDALLAHDIRPVVMLYHWELPQALQDRGGWPARDTAQYFADYARIVGEGLGDRVPFWVTHNEPFVAAMGGHFTGELAPGIQDPIAAVRASHHLLLSHGYAVDALRGTIRCPAEVGLILNLSPVHPASASDEDRAAADRYDAALNRMFLEPVFRGRYPDDVWTMIEPMLPDLQPDDPARIAAPLDFLGVNYYSRAVIRYDAEFPVIQASEVHPEGNEYSQMWEIYPPGMYEVLARVYADYHPPSLLVTENGVPVADAVDFDGRVRDERRVRYHRDHLAQVHRAIGDGVPVRGYFVWSLMDNFEWAYGYRMRFGLVHVDYANQVRTVKDSGRWYARVIGENGFDLDT